MTRQGTPYSNCFIFVLKRPSSSLSIPESSSSDSDDSSSDDEVDAEQLAKIVIPSLPRTDLGMVEDENGLDALANAIKEKSKATGAWSVHVRAFSASEACLQSQTMEAFKALPEKIADLPKSGGTGLEIHMLTFKSLITSWKFIQTSLRYRAHSPKDIKKGSMVVEATLEALRDFVDSFSPLNTQPGAISALIAFVEEKVVSALLGKSESSAIANSLKAFTKTQRQIAACSFSQLVKWKAKNQYRAQNPFKTSAKRSGYQSGSGPSAPKTAKKTGSASRF